MNAADRAFVAWLVARESSRPVPVNPIAPVVWTWAAASPKKSSCSDVPGFAPRTGAARDRSERRMNQIRKQWGY